MSNSLAAEKLTRPMPKCPGSCRHRGPIRPARDSFEFRKPPELLVFGMRNRNTSHGYHRASASTPSCHHFSHPREFFLFLSPISFSFAFGLPRLESQGTLAKRVLAPSCCFSHPFIMVPRRNPHTKSRNGCITCKTRRVKVHHHYCLRDHPVRFTLPFQTSFGSYPQ